MNIFKPHNLLPLTSHFQKLGHQMISLIVYFSIFFPSTKERQGKLTRHIPEDFLREMDHDPSEFKY